MKKLILLLLLSVNSFAQTIAFTQSEEVIFNPNRGWMKFTETNSTNYSFLSQSSLTGYKNSSDKVSVVYRGFYLESFFTAQISQQYLNNVQTDFNTLRTVGMKAVVRFAYSKTTTATPYQPTKAQIIAHIQQLSPVINANLDVISCVQIGFIGKYGEFYYTNSPEFGDGNYANYTSTQWSNRKAIVDAVLSSFSPNVHILLRYPYAVQQMYPTNVDNRISFFNDAFLGVWGDEGFFLVNNSSALPTLVQKEYVKNITETKPMVGESNQYNPPRSSCGNALEELAYYNWNILNRDYFTQTINAWVSEGCYTKISSELGYRIHLKSLNYVLTNQSLSLTLKFRNTGFGKVLKNYKSYIVIGDTKYPLQLNAKDIRGDYDYSETLNITNLPNGLHKVYLQLCEESNESKIEYMIRLSNLNTWVADKGYNDLLFQVNKTSLGIKNVTKNKLVLVPNPTKGTVEFYCEEKVNIFDVNGRKLGVRIEEIGVNRYSVDLSNLSKGVYFINGTKLIKE